MISVIRRPFIPPRAGTISSTQPACKTVARPPIARHAPPVAALLTLFSVALAGAPAQLASTHDHAILGTLGAAKARHVSLEPTVPATDVDPAQDPAQDPARRAVEGPEDASLEASPALESSEDAASADFPPRIAGAYVGGMLVGATTLVRLSDFEDAPPLTGFSMSADAGSVVLPWLSIGFSLVGGNGYGGGGNLRLRHGGLLTDLAVYPIPERPFSIRAGFGAGFGRVSEQEADPPVPGATPDTQTFGGALFKAGARYVFFPGVDTRRPDRAGGLAVGPEILWMGHTPSERGASMANTIMLGIWMGFFFGNA